MQVSGHGRKATLSCIKVYVHNLLNIFIYFVNIQLKKQLFKIKVLFYSVIYTRRQFRVTSPYIYCNMSPYWSIGIVIRSILSHPILNVLQLLVPRLLVSATYDNI